MSARGDSALPRIVLVTRRYWPQMGGPQIAMANLASELTARGHAATVVTAQWEPHWPTECVHREVPVVRLPQPQLRGWGTIRYMHALSRWLRRHRDACDAVLVSHLRHDAYAALGALRGTAIPVLLRDETAGEIGDVAWQHAARFGSRIKQACRAADAIIATSPVIAEELAEAGYSRPTTHVIPNGALLPPLRTADQKLAARLAIADANLALEMTPDAPLVVYAGRLHASKGLDDLVIAWERIAQRRPNARLWLIGEGPHREPLYDRIVDLGLHHQVFLPGAFDDVAEVLTAADLFVLPSYEEGMSLALLEAMAAGVPVVATDIAANRVLVTSEQQGLLVPPHDPAALRGAIVRLLDDRLLAEQLALAGRERASAEFSLQRMVDQHLALIQAAIAARRSAKPA